MSWKKLMKIIEPKFFVRKLISQPELSKLKIIYSNKVILSQHYSIQMKMMDNPTKSVTDVLLVNNISVLPVESAPNTGVEIFQSNFNSPNSECPKSERSVWETKQKMVRFSACSDFRHSGCSVYKAGPFYK